MSNDKNDVIFKQLTAQIEEYNSNLKKEIKKKARKFKPEEHTPKLHSLR